MGSRANLALTMAVAALVVAVLGVVALVRSEGGPGPSATPSPERLTPPVTTTVPTSLPPTTATSTTPPLATTSPQTTSPAPLVTLTSSPQPTTTPGPVAVTGAPAGIGYLGVMSALVAMAIGVWLRRSR